MKHFFNRIEKRLRIVMRKNKKFEKIKGIRGLFLVLNREKYKYFSFSKENIKFWRIASIKNREFETNLNKEIYLIKTKNILTQKDNEEIQYYNLVLKTLNKYDKNYGKFIGLVLNRTFCINISFYIRDFI
tara:strand:- start:277 stop:666 length:390 start_codon:yes stop_codon:yes gene_type:complete